MWNLEDTTRAQLLEFEVVPTLAMEWIIDHLGVVDILLPLLWVALLPLPVGVLLEALGQVLLDTF